MSGGVVSFAAHRQAALLDELAALASRVDVHELLNGGTMAKPRSEAVTLRLRPDVLATADELVELLADAPVALASGGHWSRAAVLRLAVELGMEAMRKEPPGGKP